MSDPKYIGILIKKTVPIVEAMGEILNCHYKTITFPCGFSYEVKGLPFGGLKTSVFCPCGDGKHVLIEVVD